MGMGLTISQTILENHGGDIRATSSPGVGTRFFVRLPLSERSTMGTDAGPGAADDAPADERPLAAGMR